jgi:hypothetical protein
MQNDECDFCNAISVLFLKTIQKRSLSFVETALPCGGIWQWFNSTFSTVAIQFWLLLEISGKQLSISVCDMQRYALLFSEGLY